VLPASNKSKGNSTYAVPFASAVGRRRACGRATEVVGILVCVSDQGSREESPGASPRGAVARARDDLAAGRVWKARDRLAGYLADSHDEEALDLLGEVLHSMGDLPAAGAAWFATNRHGEDVDRAIEAWRERHAGQLDQMWRSLPRSVRERPGSARVEALRRRAEQLGVPAAVGTHRSGGAAASGGGGTDPAVVIAVALALVFVVCAVVGAVTLLRWMVPG
jgi:hypothetical protein